MPRISDGLNTTIPVGLLRLFQQSLYKPTDNQRFLLSRMISFGEVVFGSALVNPGLPTVEFIGRFKGSG